MEKITVYGTEEGKLYIKPEELFALPKVQEMIKRACDLAIEEHFKPQRILEEIEAAGMDDFNDEDYEDYDDIEERRENELAELAANCTCGAWVLSKNGTVMHVADCICGAE